MNRRGFLVTAAGMSAAVVAPIAVAAPVAAAEAVAELPAAAALAEKAKNWSWWAGPYDFDDYFDGPFDTREQALAAAEENGYGEIMEAYVDFDETIVAMFNADDLRDYACDRFEEYASEELNHEGDCWNRVTDDDWRDLGEKMNAAAMAWFVERKIQKKMYVTQFQGWRNREEITRPEEDDAGQISEG